MPSVAAIVADRKHLLIEAHRPRWNSVIVWLALFLALGLAEGLVVWSIERDMTAVTVAALALVAFLMHSHLMVFHEAAHGVLCPHRRLNEAIGILLGIYQFGSLSLFRAVHHTHHAHLGTERDEELWPFVHPTVPRWLRCLAAGCELGAGIIYDAVIFWRAFLRKDSTIVNPRVRRRIRAEFVLMVTAWTLALAAVAWWGAWFWLLVLFAIPALLAGNLHTLRKYVEHMGLTGSTVHGLTRTVVPSSRVGRVVSLSMLNIPYHGIHHTFARMPQSSLPRCGALLDRSGADDPPIFPNYRSAFLAMLPALLDPRIGPQWQNASATTTSRRSG